MRRYAKLSAARPIHMLLVAFIACFFLNSCTEVNDSLGADFIPDNQFMKVRVNTITGINTYLTISDSIQANYRRQLLMGRMKDDTFGTTECGTVLLFYPRDNDFNDGKLYGHNPVADSLKLTLYIKDTYGKKDVEQTFYVYAIEKKLDRDSVYYTNFDVAQVVDFDKPLFSFTMEDEPSITVKLLDIIDQAGQDYLQSIVDTDPEILVNPYETFRDVFYGLYIAPAPDSPEDAAVYNVNLYDSGNSNYSLMVVYSHNYSETASVPTVQDTVYSFYLFDDLYPIPNMSINKVTHTYPSDIASRLNDTLVTSAPVSTAYVQSLGGVVTYLRFSDEFYRQVEQLRYYEGVYYENIIVNQARMIVPVKYNTAEMYDNALTRLGMYVNYKGLDPGAIADYAYSDESTYNIPYGGYLNRSTGYYQMDVTTHVSYLINLPDYAPKEIFLGAPAYSLLENYGQVEINGSESDDPIRIVLTYTLAK